MALTARPNMERVISGSKPPLPILLSSVCAQFDTDKPRKKYNSTVSKLMGALTFSKLADVHFLIKKRNSFFGLNIPAKNSTTNFRKTKFHLKALKKPKTVRSK